MCGLSGFQVERIDKGNQNFTLLIRNGYERVLSKNLLRHLSQQVPVYFGKLGDHERVAELGGQNFDNADFVNKTVFHQNVTKLAVLSGLSLDGESGFQIFIA